MNRTRKMNEGACGRVHRAPAFAALFPRVSCKARVDPVAKCQILELPVLKVTQMELPAPPRSRILERKKRDEQIRRAVRKARRLAPHLENPVFLPLLQSFCRISLLVERGYAELRKNTLLDENGELRASIDVVRRLAETQTRLAEKLGLTPTTLRMLSREKVLDLAAALAEDVEDAEVTHDDGK